MTFPRASVLGLCLLGALWSGPDVPDVPDAPIGVVSPNSCGGAQPIGVWRHRLGELGFFGSCIDFGALMYAHFLIRRVLPSFRGSYAWFCILESCITAPKSMQLPKKGQAEGNRLRRGKSKRFERKDVIEKAQMKRLERKGRVSGEGLLWGTGAALGTFFLRPALLL